MIYLLDTSALVRLFATPDLQGAWHPVIAAEDIGSCYPQRTEFLYGARNAKDYEVISELFANIYHDVSLPKNAGRWIGGVQHRMALAGEHRSASAVDLQIACTAAYHGLIVLHDDNDFRTIARHAPDLAERNVHDAPAGT